MTAVLNPAVPRVETAERWTHEDFMRLAPEKGKAELIEGEIYIMTPPFDEHERLQGLLFTVINFFVARFDLGQVRGSRTPVYISETDTYEPDILFVRRDRAHIITRKEVVEAPDLVIEILSSGTVRHDRETKLKNYARLGGREAWLIDPYGPAGTQFFQRSGDELIEIAPVDGFIHSIAIANFRLKTAWLWPDENGELPNPTSVLKELGAI